MFKYHISEFMSIFFFAIMFIMFALVVFTIYLIIKFFWYILSAAALLMLIKLIISW